MKFEMLGDSIRAGNFDGEWCKVRPHMRLGRT